MDQLKLSISSKFYMSSFIRLSFFPIAIAFTWISFSALNLKGTDGNIDLLQAGTSVLYERFDNDPIHCGANPDIKDCIDSALESSRDKVVLFGNSQLHAVNDISEDSELIALRLHKKLIAEDEYAFTISYGNANFEEINWAFQEIYSNMEIKRIYIACVFDDMREVGLRPEMLEKHNGKELNLNSDSKNNFLKEISFQDISEEALKKIFTDSPAWNTRYELKYQINVNLRALRNKVFGITPETKRKVLPYAYERNLGFLRDTLNTAFQNGIEVIVYIAPILQDSNIPYDEEEYLKYKREIESLADIHNALFYNYESLVPNDAWGLKQSTQLDSGLEKDYMHFTEAGHIILTSELLKSSINK